MPRAKKFTDSFKDAPSEDEERAEQIKFGLPMSTYGLSGEVATVANRVIGNHPTSLGHLVNIPLAFLFRSSRRTDEEFAVDKAAHACGSSGRSGSASRPSSAWRGSTTSCSTSRSPRPAS
jgi:hypothetical protein